MFYRLKFDGVVGKVLDTAGFKSGREKLAVWPAKLTGILISHGKESGIDAKSAAYMGIFNYYKEDSDVPHHVKAKILESTFMQAMQENPQLDYMVLAKLKKYYAEFQSMKPTDKNNELGRLG